MNWIVVNIKWIMLLSGALTCMIYLGYQAGIAVAVDTVMVALFVVYLVAAQRKARTP
jgi:uncharacterized membrane protein YtjA (UPF0391 family)